MKRVFLLISLIFLISESYGQNYTSYFTGNPVDATTTPSGGICLMGGATENDEAMKWFLNRCNGGDVLVLRTSGSNGYNDYLYSSLGVNVNSVETIVFNNATASSDPYVLQKIQKAEAIWIAGGNQWNYISYWRNTSVATLINNAISQKNIVIGGTSAGMAILSRYVFSAENGTVSSATALNNPYASNVTIDSNEFIKTPFLDSVITDTHFDNPDRRGRHIVFLARAKQDWNYNLKGIACDEYTAVCIDNAGTARVYGNYPSNDDNAYFIQRNCEIINNAPETISAGVPLTWNQTNKAFKVYNVKGTTTGANSFNLSDWQSGSGGAWQRWYVINGSFQSAGDLPPVCNILPVGFINFTVKKINAKAILNWQTVQEFTNSHFEIERSSDGINFNKFSTLSSALNNNSVKNYYYADSIRGEGVLFYRIKMVGENNIHTYSSIQNIRFENKNYVSIYPNPSNGFLQVKNSAPIKKWKIINLTGQTILQNSSNSFSQKIDVSSVSSGTYILEITDNYKKAGYKVIINK